MTSLRIAATDPTATASLRRTRHGGYQVPFMRPERLRAVPLSEIEAALKTWNEAQDRAKDDYYRRPKERR